MNIYQTPTTPQRQGPASTCGTAAMSGNGTPGVVRIHSFRTSLHSSPKTLVERSSFLENA